MSAYAACVIAEWALWVGVLVYAYDHGGASAAGFTSLGLLVPGLLMAPIIGRAADGPRPIRLLFLVYLVQSITAIVAAIGASADAPPVIVIGLVAIVVTCVAFVRPAAAVVEPSLVRSASELTSANLLSGYCQSAAVLLGPLLAAILIAVDGAALVIAACGVLTLLSALMTAPLRSLDPPR